MQIAPNHMAEEQSPGIRLPPPPTILPATLSSSSFGERGVCVKERGLLSMWLTCATSYRESSCEEHFFYNRSLWLGKKSGEGSSL